MYLGFQINIIHSVFFSLMKHTNKLISLNSLLLLYLSQKIRNMKNGAASHCCSPGTLLPGASVQLPTVYREADTW